MEYVGYAVLFVVLVWGANELRKKYNKPKEDGTPKGKVKVDGGHGDK